MSNLSGRRPIGKLIGCVLAVFGVAAQAAPAPINLAEPASYLALVDRLLRLSPGIKFEGIRQPNNSAFMRDWEYRRNVAAQRGQHILVFFNGYTEKAIAWVDTGGIPIKVPNLPPDVDPTLDRAIDLEGEEFKEPAITADGKIYMFRFKAPEW
jgi:hypothetical protein